MLSPSYPTLAEAENAVFTEGTKLINKQLDTPEAIQAAYIVCGYGLSLGFPGASAAPNAYALRTSPKAMPNINWGQLVLQLLPILIQVLQGVASGAGNPTTGGS